MAKATFTQPSFVGGEWSQTAQGNIADPKYKVAMSLCLNYIPIDTGALVRRPGTQFAADTYMGLPGRVISFELQGVLPYVMEFTNSKLRFFNGVNLASTNDPQTVSGISSANPAVVQTGTHGWTTGDQGQFYNLGTPDPILMNRQFIITVTDSTHFSIASAETGAGIDGSTLKTFTSGSFKRIATIVTPYTDALWPSVRSVQAEAQSVLLQNSTAPQVVTATINPGLDTTFALTEANFFDGPYLNPVVGATITPASVSGIVGFTIQSPTWSSTTAYNTGDYVVYSSVCYQSLIDVNLNNQPNTSSFAWAVVTQDKVVGPNGLQSSDIGRHIRLFSEPAAWASGTTYPAGASVKYDNAYYTAVVGSNTGNIPGLDLTKWISNAAAAIWTWGQITSLTGATATLVPFATGSTVSFPTSGMKVLNNVSIAFDGDTNTGQNNCAGGNVSNDAGPFTAGQYFSSGQAVSYAEVYAPDDHGFYTPHFSGNPGTLTISLYGKATSPSNETDGTLLGTSSNVGNLAGQVVQIFSSDASTAWKYLWVVFSISGNTFDFINTAEVQWYTTTSFSGTGVSAQIYGPALLYTTPITTWQLGLFTSATGYPTCGTYHEGRLWLSGLVDNRVDASALVDIQGNVAPTVFYFTPTLYTGTVSSSCAINYTLAGPGVNATYWMEPDQQGILVGTQAGEWLFQATTINSPLSPLNIQAHRVTKIGCANIEPRRTEHTLVLVQKHLRKLVEYFADIFSGKFTAPDLADKAKHLTVTGLMEIAYQQELTPVVWARRLDYKLVGMSYKRDTLMTSQGPTYAGWHQHTLGTGRNVEYLTMGSNANGTLPALTLVTNDTNTSIRHVEVMTPQFEEGSALTTAWFLDDATSAVTYAEATVGGVLGVQFYGVWHLNGETATVFAGGLDCGDWAVANGAVFVPYAGVAQQTNTLFTSAFVTTFSGAMPVVIGMTYTSQAQLVRPDGMEAGARNGPGVGKIRRVNKFVADLITTIGISFGTRFSSLNAAILKTTGGTQLAANVMFTGLQKDNLSDNGEAYASQICWQQTRPFPGTIGSITGFVETADE